MRIAHNIWSAVLSGMAVLLLSLGLMSPVVFPIPARPMSLSAPEETATEQNLRPTILAAVGLEHRLTVVETNVDEMRWELRALLGGLGGLLVEAVMRLSKRREA